LSCFTILSPVQNKWKSTSAKIGVSFLFATPFLENIAITFCRPCCIIRLFVLLCTRRWVATLFTVVQGAKQVFVICGYLTQCYLALYGFSEEAGAPRRHYRLIYFL
jgi:general stress protein CsbA